MEKHLKQLLKEYKHLLRMSDKIQNWFVETNRKYMQLEEQNYYLKWKNSYLEQWIRTNHPDAKIFLDELKSEKEKSNDIQ